MNRQSYFAKMQIAMKLSDTCVVCGEEGDFHIEDNNVNVRIFKDKETPLCQACAAKLARKILEGIDF